MIDAFASAQKVWPILDDTIATSDDQRSVRVRFLGTERDIHVSLLRGWAK